MNILSEDGDEPAELDDGVVATVGVNDEEFDDGVGDATIIDFSFTLLSSLIIINHLENINLKIIVSKSV